MRDSLQALSVFLSAQGTINPALGGAKGGASPQLVPKLRLRGLWGLRFGDLRQQVPKVDF